MPVDVRPLARIGVLGDIHAEDARLERALAALREVEVDAIVSVGDIVDGPGDVNTCVRLLRAHDVIAVRGNHDRWLVEGTAFSEADRARMGWTMRAELDDDVFAWLAALPATRALQCAAGPMLVCHGIGDDDMVRVTPPVSPVDLPDVEAACAGFAVVVAGHTHERFEMFVGESWLVNAGTLSSRGSPGYAIVDVDAMRARWFDLA